MMEVNPFKFKWNCLSCTELTQKKSTEQVNLHLCMVGSTFWDKTSIHAILYKAYGKVCQTIPQGICCLHVDLQTMCIKRSLHSTSHCSGSEQGEHCSVLLLRHSLHIQGKCSFHLGTASQHCLTSFSFSNVCGSFKPEDSVLGLVCHLL